MDLGSNLGCPYPIALSNLLDHNKRKIFLYNTKTGWSFAKKRSSTSLVTWWILFFRALKRSCATTSRARPRWSRRWPISGKWFGRTNAASSFNWRICRRAAWPVAPSICHRPKCSTAIGSTATTRYRGRRHIPWFSPPSYEINVEFI